MAECPHVGDSGCCDDCMLGLEPMTCEEDYNSDPDFIEERYR